MHDWVRAAARVCSSEMRMVTKRLPLADGGDQEQAQKLENEVRVCARLRHVNIVHYLATFVRDGTLLICLEWGKLWRATHHIPGLWAGPDALAGAK